MKVSEVMTRDVFTCLRTDSCARAAQLMWEHDCGAVPVIDAQRRPVGMVTDRDICMAAYTQGRPLADIAVSSAASSKVFGARIDDTIEVAEATMEVQQIRRLPVVDGKGQLVGMLSLNDLARRSEQPGIRRSEGLSPSNIAHALAAVSEPRLSVAESAGVSAHA